MNPEEQIPAQTITAEVYVRQGWERHAAGDEAAAEESFRQALALEPSALEAYYGLAMVAKRQQRAEEAVGHFQKVLELIQTNIQNPDRAEMLRRLAIGHINNIRTGDWGLEAELWQRNSSS